MIWHKMKKIKILFAIGLSLLAFDAIAQRSAVAAGNGIYLTLGKEFPVNFTYIIQRKAATDQVWKEIAQTNFPSSNVALKGRLMQAPATLQQGLAMSDTVVKVLWRRAEGAIYTDSIKPYDAIPLYATALGISYLDTTAVPGDYQYRIYTRNAEERNVDSTILKIAYRPAQLNTRLVPVAFEAADEAVAISYRYKGEQKPGGVKILRSRYGYNQFERIPIFAMFSNVADSTVTVTDQTAAYKMAYQYIAVPFDGLGNEGIPSDTLYVYNNSRSHDIGFFESVRADASNADKTIVLKWKLGSPGDISAIKIFKSLTWDGDYVPVGTVAAKDTVWTDLKVKPMITYYYRLQAQGPYSSSIGSIRVQALMKSPRKVVFPPQRLAISIAGNLVSLTFKKVDRDARGYYVYRREGYNGKQTLLPRLLLSTDTALSYTDTLKNVSAAAIYTYTVATINTSYEISPQSEGVSVMISGRIPVPTQVDARLTGKHALILWNNMTKESPIAGYALYRKEKNENEIAYGEMRKLADLSPLQNSYIDSTIVEGKHYGYYVACKGIGDNGADKGALSSVVTVHYQARKVMPPNQVVVVAQSKAVALSWTNPLGIPLTKIRIYRGKADEPLTLLKELTADLSEYVDQTTTPNVTYFYALSAVDSRGKESILTDPVGIRAK
jgi:fibronectin type 3 domain-containing protein